MRESSGLADTAWTLPTSGLSASLHFGVAAEWRVPRRKGDEMRAEEAPDPLTVPHERSTDDPYYGELQDSLQTFVLLTLDCLALSRSMLEASPPVADVDQLERRRRRRALRQLEAALGDVPIRPAGGDGAR
jgi:hypothetical protein